MIPYHELFFYIAFIVLICLIFKPANQTLTQKRTRNRKAKKRQTPSLRTRVAQEKRELLEIKREYKRNEHNYQTNKMNPKMEKRNK